MESFFSSLKTERISAHLCTYRTRNDAMSPARQIAITARQAAH
jgi:hypothetical protein